jgi:photosystem II stability/assembly factor-like uncharacterized protein
MNATLYAAHFLNVRHGTVVGALGTVLSTDGGGATWMFRETQGAVTLIDDFFTDPSNRLVVGNAGALFQTSDGGAWWVDRTLPCGKSCTKRVDLLEIRFTSPQSGWIVVEHRMVYRTRDAGFSWSEGSPMTKVSIFGLTFPDAAHGSASGENGLIVHLESRW